MNLSEKDRGELWILMHPYRERERELRVEIPLYFCPNREEQVTVGVAHIEKVCDTLTKLVALHEEATAAMREFYASRR